MVHMTANEAQLSLTTLLVHHPILRVARPRQEGLSLILWSHEHAVLIELNLLLPACSNT